MNDTVLVAIIGGICSLGAAGLSAWLVYRRAMKVDLEKNREDTKTVLLDKWREYSEKLEEAAARQDRKIAEQDAIIEGQDEKIAELKKTNREQGHRIEDLEQKLDLQSRQMAELERRLGNLEGEESS